jgi:hypothetical protein
MHKLRRVALVLECVIEESITHPYFTLLALLHINVVLELFEPHPIIDIACLHNRVFCELFDHIDIMDDVENERFDFLE